MVAAEDEEILRVADLEREEEADSFDTLLTAIDVVAQKQVVRVGREAAILKEAQQVVVLAVDVAAHLDGRVEFEERHLRQEDVARLDAQVPDLVLTEVHLPPRPLALDGQEALYDAVDVQVAVAGAAGHGENRRRRRASSFRPPIRDLYLARSLARCASRRGRHGGGRR